MTPRYLVNKFRQDWKRKYGSDYAVAWRKHQAMMKRLMQFYEFEDLRKAIDAYFAGAVLVGVHGCSVQNFVGNISAIMAQVKERETKAQGVQDDWSQIEAARQRERKLKNVRLAKDSNGDIFKDETARRRENKSQEAKGRAAVPKPEVKRD